MPTIGIARPVPGEHMDRLLIGLDVNFRLGIAAESDNSLDALAVLSSASHRLQERDDIVFDENFDAVLTLAKCMGKIR